MIISGLHHIAAITVDPQRNLDFYSRSALGETHGYLAQCGRKGVITF